MPRSSPTDMSLVCKQPSRKSALLFRQLAPTLVPPRAEDSFSLLTFCPSCYKSYHSRKLLPPLPRSSFSPGLAVVKVGKVSRGDVHHDHCPSQQSPREKCFQESKHWARPHTKPLREALLSLRCKWGNWVSEPLTDKVGRGDKRRSPVSIPACCPPLPRAGRFL